MKYFFSVLSIMLVCEAFAQTPDNFRISGSVTGNYKGKIYLIFADKKNDYNSREANIENGHFLFRGFLEEPVQGRLRLESPSNVGLIYLDTGFISVKLVANASGTNEIAISSIQGSRSDSLFHQFQKILQDFRLSDPDHSPSGQTALFTKLDELIRKFPDDNLSANFLNNSCAMLSYQQANTLFDHLSAKQKQRAGETGLWNKLEQLRKTEPGYQYPFIAQPDSTGKLITGKELPFRFMLVQCWASWSAACRDENTVLVSLYKKYHEKGFEILGISLDKNRTNWLRAIQNDGLTWPQVCDLKEFDNEIAKYYSVTTIPFNLLIDRDGKIIEKDLDEEKLSKKLRSIFPD